MPRAHSTRRCRWDLEEFAVGPRNGLGDPVRVATTGPLSANTRVGDDLTANSNGALVAVDGVSLAVGDRLIVKDEASGPNNGVYTVTQLGDGSTPWRLRRAEDADEDDELFGGLSFYVEEGSTHGQTLLTITNTGPVVVNTTTITFDTLALYPRLRSVATEAGPSLTGSSTETVLGSVTIPANTLVKGSVIRASFMARVTNQASATDLTTRVRLGGTTLTGTVLLADTASAPANTARVAGTLELAVRDDPGASVGITGHGDYNSAAAAGAAVLRALLDPTNFATNAALLLEVTGRWDNPDASAVQLEQLTVEVF